MKCVKNPARDVGTNHHGFSIDLCVFLADLLTVGPAIRLGEAMKPRPPRADQSGGVYHVLNRSNLRTERTF
jgi:hypothetical protein